MFCRVLNVGLMFVKDKIEHQLTVGYRTSASAVLIAKDRIIKEQLLPLYEIEFVVRFDECDEKLAVGIATELITSQNVDVIIGPTCSNAAIISGVTAAFYNIPLFTWGLSTSSAFGNMDRFPTTGLLSVNSYSLGIAIHSIMLSFEWHQFAFVYSNKGDNEKCSMMKNDIGDVFAETEDVIITTTIRLKDVTSVEVIQALRNVSARSRIVVVCLAEGFNYKRTFMLAAKDGGYLNDEYVYIFADTKSKGYYVAILGEPDKPIWEDMATPSDGRDKEALMAFGKTLVVSNHLGSGFTDGNYDEFKNSVISRMKEPPFNCVEDCKAVQYSKVVDRKDVYSFESHSATLFAYQSPSFFVK
ncbi:ligand-binding protein, receptor family [Dictyocaulus viviparus]|uniref:guanylate cyclase n=1 Tax=Dictyocaulus viviparus TaxID=29172 RepID=A0A0D8X872_DICVI|nr:ligand-binding protein, receptor family [Dictyocaulus viviparus]